MPKCKCSHAHCCHEKTIKKEMKSTERGRPCSFIRESCNDPKCNKIISDTDFKYLDLK